MRLVVTTEAWISELRKFDVVLGLQPTRCSLCWANSYVDLQGVSTSARRSQKCSRDGLSGSTSFCWSLFEAANMYDGRQLTVEKHKEAFYPLLRRQSGRIEMTSAGLSVHPGLLLLQPGFHTVGKLVLMVTAVVKCHRPYR